MQKQKEICRLCRKSDINTISLLDGRGSSGILFREMLKTTCQIEITQEDPFPKAVCPLCIWNLNTSFNFQLMCKNSEKWFSKSSGHRKSNKLISQTFNSIPKKQEHSVIKNEITSSDGGNQKDRTVENVPEKEEIDIWADGADEDDDRYSLSSLDSFDWNRKPVNNSFREQLFGTAEKEEQSNSHGEDEKDPPKKKKTKREEGLCLEMCEICGKKYMWKGDLASHIRSHSKGESITLECGMCGKKYKSKQTLQAHLYKHIGKRDHICEICGKDFVSAGNLKHHKRIHTGEKPYQCKVCSRSFNRIGNLNLHMRSHTGETPFQCEFCSKPFAWKNNLIIHRRSHLNDRRFQCEICKRKFLEKAALNDHTRIHTGERPFQCTFCDRNFSQRNALRGHMKTHSECRVFECHLCKRKYLKEVSLELHLRTHENFDVNQKREEKKKIAEQEKEKLLNLSKK